MLAIGAHPWICRAGAFVLREGACSYNKFPTAIFNEANAFVETDVPVNYNNHGPMDVMVMWNPTTYYAYLTEYDTAVRTFRDIVEERDEDFRRTGNWAYFTASIFQRLNSELALRPRAIAVAPLQNFGAAVKHGFVGIVRTRMHAVIVLPAISGASSSRGG